MADAKRKAGRVRRKGTGKGKEKGEEKVHGASRLSRLRLNERLETA